MHKILPTLFILINKSIFKISLKLEETNIDIFNFKDVSDIYFNLTKIVLRLSLKFRAYRSISQWPLTISQAWKNNILVLNWTTSIENKARSSKTFSYTLIIILTSGSYCNVKITVSTAVNLIAQLSGAVRLFRKTCHCCYCWSPQSHRRHGDEWLSLGSPDEGVVHAELSCTCCLLDWSAVWWW